MSATNNKEKLKTWFKKTFVKNHQTVIAIFSTCTFFLVFMMGYVQSCQTNLALERTRKNYIDENRPFVFPGRPTKDSTKYGIVAHLPITNYGNSPAYKVNLCVYFQCANDSTFSDPRKFKYNSKTTWITLAPRSTDIWPALPDSQHWNEIPTAHFYVTGAIWYNDYWTKTRHYNTFVYELLYRYGNFERRFEYETVDTVESY